jgi:hypothetical protein
MTWNLPGPDAKDPNGIPAGNRRSGWDAGCRYDW